MGSENEIKNLLEIVKKINEICSNRVKGVECNNIDICQGNCCYSSNEIPKFLYDYYNDNQIAIPDNFVPSDTLAYRIKIEQQIKRCALFSKEKNGCKIYWTNMKPPQCCLYPIDFKDPTKHTCRKGYNFDVSIETVEELEMLLNTFWEYSNNEYKFLYSKDQIIKRLKKKLPNELGNYRPDELYSIKDNFNNFHIIKTMRRQMQLLDFCEDIGCESGFYSCTKICEKLKKRLLNFLIEVLPEYISSKKPLDEYPFFILLNFKKEKDNE